MTDLESIQIALEKAHRDAPREPRGYRDALHEMLFHCRQARQYEHVIAEQEAEP